MSLIIDTVLTHLPVKRKTTPSGWISFNAVCCHHMGTGQDRRQRGGIMLTDGISYHCFNCGFKASWQPGRQLGPKLKKLLEWLNVSNDLITRCSFDALRQKDEIISYHSVDHKPAFIDKAMPLGTRPILEWLDDPPEQLIPVLEYIYSRGFTIDDYPWHWTDEDGFQNRLIIPFYYENRCVGWTARLLREGKIKYISEQQPGYVFNLDNQQNNRKYCIITEGPLDAISIDGCAVMSNEISPQQVNLITQLDREIVVLPDRDQAGTKLIEQAIDLGWSVSMPDWGDGIKDANDALQKYGRLYTLHRILQCKEKMPLKIQLRMKKWVS